MNRLIKFRIWPLRKQAEDEVPVVKKFITDTYEVYDSRLNDIFTSNNGVVFQQFTGLKDDQGNEIYEGDICNIRRYSHIDKSRRWLVAEVIWGCEHGWNFRTYCGKDFVGTRFTEVEEIEVIGNIFENKELLA